MELHIKNHGRFNNVDIYLYNNKNRPLKKRLVFESNEARLIVNEDKYFKLRFKSEDLTSSLIPINQRITCFDLYEEKDGYLNIYIVNQNKRKTGSVKNENFKDERYFFYLPNKSKKTFIYIPESYQENKEYSLLIALDGQNMFNKKTTNNYTRKNDPFGSWQLDRVLSLIDENTIVVGIDNATKYRDYELLMKSDFGEYGEIYYQFEEDDVPHIGRLDELGDFIKQKLIPYMKSKYKINNKIGIIGSSSGGIGAFYLGIRDNDIYSHIFSFSPAINLFTKEAYAKYFKNKTWNSKYPFMYFYFGEGDIVEKELIPSYMDIQSVLEDNNYPNNKIKFSYNKKGKHNEIHWRYELIKALPYFR